MPSLAELFFTSYLLQRGRLPGFNPLTRVEPVDVVRHACEVSGDKKELFVLLLISIFTQLCELHEHGDTRFSRRDAPVAERDTYLKGLVSVLIYLRDEADEVGREIVNQTFARLYWREITLSSWWTLVHHAVNEGSSS